MVTPDFLSSMTATEIRYLRGNHYFTITCEHPGDTPGLLPLFTLSIAPVYAGFRCLSWAALRAFSSIAVPWSLTSYTSAKL